MCRLQSGVVPDTPMLSQAVQVYCPRDTTKESKFLRGVGALMTGVEIWMTGVALASPVKMLKLALPFDTSTTVLIQYSREISQTSSNLTSL